MTGTQATLYLCRRATPAEGKAIVAHGIIRLGAPRVVNDARLKYCGPHYHERWAAIKSGCREACLYVYYYSFAEWPVPGGERIWAGLGWGWVTHVIYSGPLHRPPPSMSGCPAPFSKPASRLGNPTNPAICRCPPSSPGASQIPTSVSPGPSSIHAGISFP